jgi:hypothetical protein
MVLLNDGAGTSQAARVNSVGMLSTTSVASSVEHYINHTNGKAFNALFSQSPTANDDCIFYMQNSDNLDMTVEGLNIAVDAACEVYIKVGVEGTRNSATDITPVNCNTGSGNLADGIFEQGVDLDGGAATLSGGSEIERIVFHAASDSSFFNFEQDYFISKNRTFSIWCSSSAATVTGTVVFNYHDDNIV